MIQNKNSLQKGRPRHNTNTVDQEIMIKKTRTMANTNKEAEEKTKKEKDKKKNEESNKRVRSLFAHEQTSYEMELNMIIESQKNEQKSFKTEVLRILNTNKVLVANSIVVAIALFANDLKYILFDKSADKYFNVIFILILLNFLLELIINILAVAEYCFSFFFYLDLIALLSMLFEVDWILIATVNALTIFSNEDKDYKDYSLEKSSRSARIVITISVLRIIRLIRSVKLYKNYRIWEAKKDGAAKCEDFIKRKEEYEKNKLIKENLEKENEDKAEDQSKSSDHSISVTVSKKKSDNSLVYSDEDESINESAVNSNNSYRNIHNNKSPIKEEINSYSSDDDKSSGSKSNKSFDEEERDLESIEKKNVIYQLNSSNSNKNNQVIKDSIDKDKTSQELNNSNQTIEMFERLNPIELAEYKKNSENSNKACNSEPPSNKFTGNITNNINKANSRSNSKNNISQYLNNDDEKQGFTHKNNKANEKINRKSKNDPFDELNDDNNRLDIVYKDKDFINNIHVPKNDTKRTIPYNDNIANFAYNINNDGINKNINDLNKNSKNNPTKNSNNNLSNNFNTITSVNNMQTNNYLNKTSANNLKQNQLTNNFINKIPDKNKMSKEDINNITTKKDLSTINNNKEIDQAYANNSALNNKKNNDKSSNEYTAKFNQPNRLSILSNNNVNNAKNNNHQVSAINSHIPMSNNSIRRSLRDDQVNLDLFKNSNVEKLPNSNQLFELNIEKIKELFSNYLPKKTTISQVIADTITRNIIIIILIMLILNPLTNDESYDDGSMISYVMLCQLVNTYISSNNMELSPNITINEDFNNTILNVIDKYTDSSFPIKTIEYNNILIYQNSTFNEKPYRLDEELFAFSKHGLTEVSYINTTYTKDVAIISIIRTVIVILLVLFLASRLEEDSKDIILKPLGFMIEVVNTVSKDPSNTKNIEKILNDVTEKIRELKQSKKKHKSKNISDDNNSQYEVQVIILAIARISALLALSFGEAGGEIIKENISGGTGRELNPIIKGKKKTAIFGFCFIYQFNEINEALQEKVMFFENEIAEIVHSAVDRFGGSTNKNIGETFLMVWTEDKALKKNMLKEERKKIEKRSFNEAKKETRWNSFSYTADQSLLAYLYCIQKINKSYSLRRYRYMDEIVNRLGINFKVEMGFGLHTGWAIEGAIGSFYKIDASYLSPNVNISARLMAATKQYKVPILLSGSLYNELSPEIKTICRKIDVVKVKGSLLPLDLYTVDVNTNPKMGREKDFQDRKLLKKYLAKKKEQVKMSYFKNNNSFRRLIRTKRNFKELLKKKRGDIFYNTFKIGLESYIKGDWQKAHEYFDDCYYIDSTDGPTVTLLNYIRKFNYQAPSDWEGCRQLTSK